MAVNIETQRLISVSLGKIAQSRGQRGGINLHKNLLVATVLHKARTAYMMENFGYHQQHQLSLQRQKIEQEQQQEQTVPQHDTAENARGNESPVARDEPVCQPSCDSEVGQSAGPSPAGTEDTSSHAFVPPIEDAQDEMAIEECETSAVDKENSPPLPAAFETLSRVPDVTDASPSHDVTESEHVIAANKLSQEAQQIGLVNSSQNYSSGSPTCTGILKRRRDNVIIPSSDFDCSGSKKARVTHDSSTASRCSQFSLTSSSTVIVTSVPADLSSDYSASEDSDSESNTDFSPMQTDNPQITNLVSIFNSGFSGLCAAQTNEYSSVSESCDQNDLDISSPPTYTTLTNMRPESPSPASVSRKMSEPSLMCSAEVGRLHSLPSALLLSA